MDFPSNSIGHSNTSFSAFQGSPIDCTKCNRPLSVGPIYISVSDGSNICGRCKTFPEKETIVRNIAYEKIASTHTFPCAYEGCIDVLAWPNVQEHEVNCIFKPFPCVIDNCKWNGSKRYMLKHFKEDHKNIYSEGNIKFKLDTKNDKKLTLLLMPFIIKVHFSVKTSVLKIRLISLGLHYIENIASITCSIQDNYKNKIEKNEKYYFGHPFSILFRNIFSLLNESEIHCSVDILYNKLQLKSAGLKVFCHSCNILLTDDVYIHNFNTSVYCKRCKISAFYKISYNSYCKMLDNNIKSKAIDSDNDYVNCPYIQCPYKFKKEVLKNHINKCNFKTFNCQKCTFKEDFDLLKRHYIDYHSAVVDNKHFWTTNLNFGNETVEIILNNTIFHVKKIREKNNCLFDSDDICCIQFNIDLETIVDNKASYSFQIELLHQKSDYFNLLIRGKKQESSLIGKICVDNSNLHEYRNEADTYTFKIVITSF